MKITRMETPVANWIRVVNAARRTWGKKPITKEPSDKFKKKILLAEHSPIRLLEYDFTIENIRQWVTVHLSRHHEGCEKFIGTERAHRTEVKDRAERSQMNYVPMEMDANIQALMNIAERRLCMCADPITREYMEALVEEIRKYDEDIAWSLVPQCVRCGGCVEPFGNCQYYNNTFKDMPIEEQSNVIARYDYYDNQRVKKLTLKKKGDYNG